MNAATGPRIGSLCTGYGGLDDAVHALFGGETVWHADNDPGASAILAHHWPTVPNLGDITAVNWTTVAPVDVVTGGYPCQPFSVAGKRKGTTDARHLWPHVARAIGVLRPRIAILENVAGHLRLGFDTVLADLARLGFDARWCCVRASQVGAPHRRERLFVLAWPADAGGPRLAWRGATRATPHRGGSVADAAHLGRERRRSARHGWPGSADVDSATARAWRPFTPAVARWEHVTGRPAPAPTDDRGRLSPAAVEWLMGLPAGHVTEVPGLSWTAQLKALGNGVVPLQAAAALRLLLADQDAHHLAA